MKKITSPYQYPLWRKKSALMSSTSDLVFWARKTPLENLIRYAVRSALMEPYNDPRTTEAS